VTEVIFEGGNQLETELTAFAADLLSPNTVGLIPTQGTSAPEVVEAAPDITPLSPVLVGRLAVGQLVLA
jgi:hypothetical protein